MSLQSHSALIINDFMTSFLGVSAGEGVGEGFGEGRGGSSREYRRVRELCTAEGGS